MGPLSIGVLVSSEAPRAQPRATSDAGDASAASGAIPRGDGRLDEVSAAEIAASLEALGHRAIPIRVDGELDQTLRRGDVDLCFLALHGTAGGCGEVQSLLAMRGIPFVGPAAAPTTLAFDKVRARQMLAYHNLPVPASVALGNDTPLGGRALGLLGWPCVLKPRRGALRCGVSHLTDASQIEHALDRALAIDDELVLERAIEGDEIQVVLLGERVLGAMQVHRGLESSVDPVHSEMMCPPQHSRARLDGLHNLARRAVDALGLDSTLTRVDILLSSRHNEVVLEVEPLPPLHRDGVVARVARAAGIDHQRLCATLLGEVAPAERPRVPTVPLPMVQ